MVNKYYQIKQKQNKTKTKKNLEKKHVKGTKSFLKKKSKSRKKAQERYQNFA